MKWRFFSLAKYFSFLDQYPQATHPGSLPRCKRQSRKRQTYRPQIDCILEERILMTATNTALALNHSSLVYGDTLQLTATVTPQSGTDTPTGTVTFRDCTTSTDLATRSLDGSGGATYSFSTLAAGSHTLRAIYNGDGGDGFDASTSSSSSETISAHSLTITAANVSMTYADSTTLNGATGFTSSGLQNSETIGSVTLSTDASTSTSRNWNAGTWTITPSAATGGTFNAGNYTITYATGTLTVNTLALTVSGVTANSKTYDRSTSTGLSFNSPSLSTPISLDDVSLDTGSSYAATFASYNAGTGIAVAVGGLMLTGADSSNYSLTQPTGLTADITKAPLTVSGITVGNKVYDRSNAATLSLGSALLSGVVSDDLGNVSLGSSYTATFSGISVGTSLPITVSALGLTGSAAGNYCLTQPTGLTANITPKTITIAGGVTAVTRAYSTSTSATLSIGSVTFSGVISGDGGSVDLDSSSYTANFASANAGSNIAVTVSGLGLNGASSPNYTLTQPSLTATITPATVTVSGVTANNKVYDGGSGATLSLGSATLSGVFSSDSSNVSLGSSYTATFTSPNVATGIGVTVSGLGLTGAAAGNYALTQPTGLTADITPKSLTITSGVSATNKVYNGSTAATLSFSSPALSGVVAGDSGHVGVDTGSSYTATFLSATVGTGIAVTVSGLALCGSAAGNYCLTQPSLSANITPAALTISGVAATSKVYDGLTTDTLDTSLAALVGLVSGDSVSLIAGSGSFTDKNVGAGKTVTASGFTISGPDAGNYTVLQPGGLSANITQAALTITGVSATNKVYDGGTADTLDTSSAGLSGVIGSDAVTLHVGSGSFGDKNVGTGKTVTASGFTISGADSSNYSLSQPGSLSANITMATLTITGVAATNKVYDGGTGDSLNTSSAALSGVASGDTVMLNSGSASGSFANKSAGTGKTVTASGFTISGTDSGNYCLSQPSGLSANITLAPLTVSGVSATDKVYDGGTAATLSTGGEGLSGVISGDDVSLNGGSASGSFADKNVGTSKTVTVTGFTISGGDAGNYSLAQPSLTAAITAKTLTVTASASDKVYDGTTTATVSFSDDRVSGDSLTVHDSSATFSDKNVGTDKTVTVSGLSLSGTDAGNYTLASSSVDASADITVKTLTVSASASNKVYDGGTSATVSLSDDRVSGDSLTVSDSSPTFADKNVGTGKTVTASGLSLSGTDAGNYTLASSSVNTTANITPASLTITGVSATDKVYDGSTSATLDISDADLSGVLGTDSVTLNSGSASGSFANKNVGSGKTVTATGFTIGDTDAGNYTVSQPGGLSANITQATLTVTVSASNKVYDGTTTATVSFSDDRISGDSLTVHDTSATFADKNVGTGKTVTASGLSLSGTDAGNYSLASSSVDTSADITVKTLTVSASASNKVYDGGTSATVSLSDDRVSGDSLSVSDSGAAFANKNVGTGKTVTVSGLSLSGTDAGNYTLASSSTSTSANITAAPLTITGVTATNKVYDGSTVDTLNTGSAALSGVIGGDSVTLNSGSASGSFADANAGTGKTVTASGFSISGGDAGNYTLSQPSGLTANITPASTVTLLTPSANGLAPGQSFSLTAAVTSGVSGTISGTVTFTDGGTTLGSASLSGGQATITVSAGLTAGSHTITASYAGSTNFSSSSGGATVVIGPPAKFIIEQSCNCGCPNQPGSQSSVNGAAGAAQQTALSTSQPVRYADGAVTIAATDLMSDGFGMPWGQTRTWTNAPGYAAATTNGVGWVDTQTPSLMQIDGTTTLAEISNGVTAEYFTLVDGTYQPYSYDQSTLVHDTTNHQYVLTDETGDQVRFGDFSGSTAAAHQGQFVSFTDPAGNVTAVTAYASGGQIGEVQRSAGSVVESWLYSYLTTGVNSGMLQNVTLRRSTDGGSSWTVVQQVQYAYYDGSQPYGNVGDLMTATIEDGAANVLDTYYYRYYTAADVAAGANGYAHGLKYVFTPDSYARLAAAYSNPFTATDSQVAPYASNYFEYDTQLRATKEVAQSQGCSACSGGLGTFTFSYTSSDNTPGYNSWATKTTETLPDGTEDIVYTNAYGEVMLSVTTDGTNFWDTFYEYDDQGRLILMANPSAVSGYDDSYADLLHKVSGNYADLRDSSGLITLYDYYSSTTADDSTAGGVAGYLEDEQLAQGEEGTPVLQETWQYYAHTAGGITVNPVATDTVYRNDDGTGAETTTFTYTWFTDSTQEQSETVSLPVVGSDQNGPGTADVSTTYFNIYGEPIWTKDAGGFLTYTAYDTATGAVVETIDDVNTCVTSDYSNKPSGWHTPTGGGLNLVTQYVVDGLGRVTEETDPNGNVTYTVYNDPAHEVRIYQGWNSSTHLPTGPTEVEREDLAGSYSETLTMTATPALNGDDLPTGTEAIADLQTLSRSFISAGGQVIATDDYFDLSGLTYSTSATLGTVNVNYYETTYGYDHAGRPDRTVSPTGTITRTVYNALGEAVSVWVGTNDTPTSGYWSPSNPAGMTEVTAYQYDDGGIGDGNLTQETDYPGGGAAARVTQYFYDWRDRQVAEKDGVQTSEDSTTYRPITFTTYDNLDEAVEVQQYDGDGVTISTVDGEPEAPSASLLVSQVVYANDDQGRVYQEQVYSVDPSTGDVSSTALTTNYYFDHRGNQVAESNPGGLWTKDVYDGAGRLTFEYTTDGGSGTSWADAGTVSDDIVLEQTQTIYDNNGNVIETLDSQRFHDATGTGALGGPDSTDAPKARVYYAASYYDAADRLTADVDVGTNGGSAWTRPDSVPSRSDTVLVTSYDYDDAGWVQDVIDPMAIDTRTEYDDLGRTIKTIQDYTDGTPTNDSNVTTEYTYDGANHVLTLTAVQPSGTPSQTTQYVYGVATSGGSAVTSNDLLAAVWHPDPSTGAASSSQADTYTYNALGDTVTFTDRNGSTHTYSYDVLGRQTADAVTTLGEGVDGSVRRIETAYDAQGNPYLVTSYDSASGGDVVNQVLRQYNGLGQLTAEYQAVGGAVDLDTTPSVQYAYSEMADGANNSRLVSITYPSGYELDYNYGTSGSLDDRISRLTSLSDNTGTLESYTYLGLDTVVLRGHPENGMDLTYISPTADTGDGGDQYVGLDRFGRVVDQLWLSSGTSTTTDEFQYGYDRDGNVLFRKNVVDSVFSELYQYDALNQLTSFARGELNSSNDAIVGTPSASQSWATDALGNFTSVTTDGTMQERTANAQNELGTVGDSTLIYDANGNLTTDETGRQFVYDAWNRLVEVKNSSGTMLETFSYDGLGRRVTVTASGTTTDLYYSDQWQVLEEQVGGQTQTRYVWSPVYVDALVLRDRDTTGDGTLDERLYVQQDANWNVTALVNTSGDVVERYVYSPYGVATVLAADWSSRDSSSYDWVYLHQGGRFDPTSGLYSFRNRDFSPTLGRWVRTDPLGFDAGDTNVYRYEGNGPIDVIDPTGCLSPSGIFDGIDNVGKIKGEIPTRINPAWTCDQILLALGELETSCLRRRVEQRRYGRNSPGWLNHERRIKQERALQSKLFREAHRRGCFGPEPLGCPRPVEAPAADPAPEEVPFPEIGPPPIAIAPDPVPDPVPRIAPPDNPVPKPVPPAPRVMPRRVQPPLNLEPEPFMLKRSMPVIPEIPDLTPPVFQLLPSWKEIKEWWKKGPKAGPLIS